MKKFLRFLLTSAVSAVVVTWIMFGSLVKAAWSFEKLDEGLYTFEFSGNDGFDGYLKQGGSENAFGMSVYIVKYLSRGFSKVPEAEPQKQDFGCSTMAVNAPEGDRLMGRNFDWQDCQCVIARVNPRKGYKYISAFNPDFLGFGDGWKPEGFANQYMALSCMFLALDGVNEKGFAVADLTAGQGEETHQDNGNPDMTTTVAIKYLLKTAASVDEAIDLLSHIDFHSDIGTLHHLSMSDASGKSVVVEYVGDKMVVTPTDIVTNHYLCPENFGYGKFDFDHRFETLQAAREAAEGTMEPAQLLDAMSQAWQSWSDENSVNGGTQWTAIFNLSNPGANYIRHRDTSKEYHFDFSSKRR